MRIANAQSQASIENPGYRSLAVLVLFLMSFGAGFAQLSTTATITGAVTDQTGAAVPGATITITNTATKVANVTQSNAEGAYEVPGLNVATYSVTIVKAGFEKYTITDVELHPTVTTTVNGSLTVGAETQSVTVQAVSSEIETASAEVSADISSEEVSTLPINGRNYQALAVLMPGVTNLQQGSAMTTGGRSTSSQLSINGMAVARSFYALDGVWNENTGNMTQTSVIPNPDSLEEVRVLQNNFSAQYSLMGSSVILLQTKSGTAKFHGAAWEFWRNNDLNSKNYFATVIAPYHQNIFGYNVGGPVFIPKHYNADRKKTFFFFDEQFVILHVPNQMTSTLPTPTQIGGCFGSPIKDPTTGLNFAAGTLGGASCASLIPSARINTSSTAYLTTLYPAPNYNGNPTNNVNYENNQAQITDQRDDEIKIDHIFSPKFHALGEFLDEYQSYAQNSVSNGTTPISSETDFTHNKLAQLSLTQTLTPNMVNTTSVAMNIFLLNLTLVGKTDVSQIPNFNETLFYNGYLSTRTPQVSITGLAGQGITAARPIPHASDLDDTFSDNWSWLKGKHYLTAGITLVWNTKRQLSGQQSNGAFTFSGASTKPASGAVADDDSIADTLLGYVASFNQAQNMPHGDIHNFSQSPYLEDQYKFNKNLSLTVGLRIYHLPLPYGAPDSETNWYAGGLSTANCAFANPIQNYYCNPAFNFSAVPTVNEFSGATNLKYPATYSNGLLFNSGQTGGLPINFSKAHNWYFGPDAGFAWNVFGDGKTSLRGGFGISYTRIFTNQDCSFNCAGNPPISVSQNLSNLVFPSTSAWNIVAAGGAANTESVQSVAAADYMVQASPVDSYSLGIQHEFPKNTIVSVVGAGSRIQHMVGTINYNQAPYFTGTVSGNTQSCVSTCDFNPLLNANSNNAGKPDNSAYYAPYQGYAAINAIASRLWQEWSGLEIQAKHPVTKSVYASVAYTWSHNLYNSIVDPYNLSRYHGNAEGLNFPQSLAITVLYEVPFFRNDTGWKGYALGGWRLNDITTFRSGSSFTPSLTGSTQGLSVRPNLVAGQPLEGPKTWRLNSSREWFNTAAFVPPPNGFYGQAQTGILRGPGQEVWNLSLFKNFKIKDSGLVEFRAEAFNLLNHANPNNPNAAVPYTTSSSYGQISSAADPRILELALRLKF